MVASVETVAAVIETVQKHVSPGVFQAIVRDLLKVRGNRSFEETIRRLDSSLSGRKIPHFEGES